VIKKEQLADLIHHLTVKQQEIDFLKFEALKNCRPASTKANLQLVEAKKLIQTLTQENNQLCDQNITHKTSHASHITHLTLQMEGKDQKLQALAIQLADIESRMTSQQKEATESWSKLNAKNSILTSQLIKTQSESRSQLVEQVTAMTICLMKSRYNFTPENQIIVKKECEATVETYQETTKSEGSSRNIKPDKDGGDEKPSLSDNPAEIKDGLLAKQPTKMDEDLRSASMTITQACAEPPCAEDVATIEHLDKAKESLVPDGDANPAAPLGEFNSTPHTHAPPTVRSHAKVSFTQAYSEPPNAEDVDATEHLDGTRDDLVTGGDDYPATNPGGPGSTPHTLAALTIVTQVGVPLQDLSTQYKEEIKALPTEMNANKTLPRDTHLNHEPASVPDTSVEPSCHSDKL
jgi:hypothetical protein